MNVIVIVKSKVLKPNISLLFPRGTEKFFALN